MAAMLRQNVVDLWSSITGKLSPPEVRKILSLLLEFKLGRIGKTQLITSALLLLEKDEDLHRRFTEIFCENNPQEEQEVEDAETRNNDIEEVEVGELDPKNEDEANHHPENPKEDQKIEEDEANLFEIRVDIEENSKGKKTKKKREILEDQIETSLKVTRRSKRLEQVTPSYKHTLEEEQCKDSDDTETVLNYKYVSVGPRRKGEGSIPKKRTEYEEAMAKCEDDMFEVDRWIGTLSNAMKSAEEVMNGEIGLEEIGTMFYRCIKQLYGQDMAEIVRHDYQNALHVIIPRLKQKLDEAKLVRKTWEPLWKQVFEENTVKQIDSTAQGRKKK